MIGRRWDVRLAYLHIFAINVKTEQNFTQHLFKFKFPLSCFTEKLYCHFLWSVNVLYRTVPSSLVQKRRKQLTTKSNCVLLLRESFELVAMEHFCEVVENRDLILLKVHCIVLITFKIVHSSRRCIDISPSLHTRVLTYKSSIYYCFVFILLCWCNQTTSAPVRNQFAFEVDSYRWNYHTTESKKVMKSKLKTWKNV